MMRKLLIALLCMLIVVGAMAQESTPKAPLSSVDIVSKQLDKANKALSRKLDRINRKLEKKLLKLYPELKGVNIDSLLEERVYQQDKWSGNEQVSIESPIDSLNLSNPDLLNTDSLLIDKVKELELPDSTITAIEELREELIGELGQTPNSLELNPELRETMAKLGKTEELMKQIKSPEFPELPELNIPSLPEIPDIEQLMPEEVTGLESKLAEYAGLMDKFKGEFEGWDQKLLAKATNLEQVKLLQQQKELMDNYQPLPDGYRENLDQFQTNDFVKEKLQNKAEEIKKVGGQSLQEKFDAAQNKLSEAKEKFNSLNSLDDAPERKPNPYKGEPFLKRLKPGANFQVNRQEPTSIDAALQLSYIINPKARIGTGFSYRIPLEKAANNPGFDDQVLTTRGFFDYTLFKSIYAEALYEWTRVEVKDPDNVVQSKRWVQSGMVGLGNRFTIKGKLEGFVTTLYNFLHDGQGPYSSPWVIRVGFGLKQ